MFSIVRNGKESMSANCGGDSNSSAIVARHHRNQQPPGETSEISTTIRDRSDSYMSSLEYETESEVEAPIRSGSEANFQSSKMKSDSNPTQINKKAKRKVVNEFQGFQIKCEKCRNVFNGNDELEYHSINYHTKGIIRMFSCYLCGTVISSKYQLGQHMNSLHVGVKRFTCAYSMCSIAFAQHPNAIHARKKTALKCPRCGEKFYRKHNLTKHLTNKHEKDMRYCCYLCKKFLTTRSSLRMHMNAIHIGLIPPNCHCATCMKECSIRINQHKRTYDIHTTRIAFKCPKCSETFFHTRSVSSHLMEKHHERNSIHPLDTNEMPHLPVASKNIAQASFKCPFPMCDSMVFAQPADLKLHTNTVHAIQIKLRSNAHIAKNLKL